MTLDDVLSSAVSDVSIMNGIFPMITIFSNGDYRHLLDQHTLNSEIRKMDVYDTRIRVWFSDKED